ncbi:MAG TPA: hypothetical protein VFA26_03360, partial [Gemmataceae bacterium]|nr:hypothetical protein [Gemmataceae bacterium]
MRAARVLLVGTLGLLLAACTGAKDKGKDNVRADLGKPKDLIVGKWKAADPAQLVQVCEFADDGTLKVTLKDVREAAAGKYRFTDDSTMEVEFQAPAEVKKAYRESVKAAKKAAAEAAGAGAVGKD